MKDRCVAVRARGFWPAREYRSHPAPVAGYKTVTHRVHAAVQRMQSAGINAPADCTGTKTQLVKLNRGYDAVLPAGEIRQQLLLASSGNFVPVCGLNLPLGGHWPRVVPETA